MKSKLSELIDGMGESIKKIDQTNLEIPLDSKPTLHPAMDLFQGHLMYGIPNKKSPLFVSNRKLIPLAEIEQVRHLGDYPAQSRFTREGIKKYLNGSTVNPVELYESIRGIIVKHVIFKFDWQPSVVAAWILGTYLHRIFPLYPYLWFKSPVKRCGKTTLQEIVAVFAFNADAPETSVTEATLFRVPAMTGGALIWDEAEGVGKNKDKSDLLSILNTSYRREGIVKRCDGKDYKVKFHAVYRPITLSGISSLPDTVADRSLKIELGRKRRDESVERLAYRSLETYKPLRDNLHIFALDNADTILKAYDQFNNSLIPNECDDRLRDAFEVMIAIAAPIMNADKKHPVLSQLQAAAKALSGIRGLDESDTSFVKAIEILKEELDGRPKLLLNAKEALDIFISNGIDWMEKTRHASDMLNKLGFYSTAHREGDKLKRGYLINKEHLEDLFARYGSLI